MALGQHRKSPLDPWKSGWSTLSAECVTDRRYRGNTPDLHPNCGGLPPIQGSAHAVDENSGSPRKLLAQGSVWVYLSLDSNGYAERWIRILREEELSLTDYKNFADAYRHIGQFITDVYNRRRIHSSLGYLTPAEFEAQWREQQSKSLP